VSLPGEPDPKAVYNERAKTTASYLNAAAGTCLGAGVVAPVAARVFGVMESSSPVPPLTLTLGILIFLAVSLGLHACARYVLRGLRR
jgi:hypothetical protein